MQTSRNGLLNRKAEKKSDTNYFDCKLFNLEAYKNFILFLNKQTSKVEIFYLKILK